MMPRASGGPLVNSFIPAVRVMRMGLPTYWASLLLACLACEGPGSETTLVTTRDSAGVTIVESPPGRLDSVAFRIDSLPALSIGVTEGEPAYMLFGVRQARRLADGGILVADLGSAELRYFDSRGRHVRTVGGRGSGPGEYEWPHLVRWPGSDTLLVHDQARGRYSVLGPDGRLARTGQWSVPPGQMVGRLPDGAFLDRVSTGGTVGMDPEERVVEIGSAFRRLDGDGSTVDTLFTLPGLVAYLWNRRGRPHFLMVPFTVAPPAAVDTGGFILGSTDAWELRAYSADGRLRRIARVREPALTVTPDAYAAAIDTLVTEEDADDARAMRERYARVPLPRTVPPFSELRVDPAGRVWARRYTPGPTGSASREWVVFDPAGALLGTARMPAGVEVVDIGTDQVLGRTRDDLGVERVVGYRVSGPAS